MDSPFHQPDSATAAAAPLSPTPASAWKGKSNMGGTDLLLPSGNVARVRMMTPTDFLTSGVLPDPLANIVQKAIDEKSGLPPSKIAELGNTPENLEASLELFDRVLAYAMIMPLVLMPPTCSECGEYFNVDDRHTNVNEPMYHPYTEGPRREDVMYADQIDMVDKIFVFKFVMTGVRNLESFRSELPTSLGGVPDVQDVQHEAVSTP